MPDLPATWTPLALAADLPPGTSAGAVLDGAEVVIWRDTAGRLHAWEDRCPHRGMKLSFGFVRGDRIACLYHGWEYDGAGTCRYIPAHPELEVPASICVPAHAAAEALGLVWVAASGADPATLPSGTALPLRSLFVEVPLAAIAARLEAGGLPGAGSVTDARRDGALLRFTQGGTPMIAGLHPVGPSASALHLVLPEDAPPDRRRDLVIAAAALRRAAEATGREAA
jgi:nitrite reductase/ring-hydroxylating ferredoxin subunit